MANSDQYVGLSFIFLAVGIAFVGYVLRLAFFRDDSLERRLAGFVVVFIGAVVGMVLVDKAIF